ncbi:unnamed protein product [Paramecium primaurelia]|uniref:Uncharacterized protein n=1 Tax=Paramecium primaurelia TaxID=5886 RepID=A0A8S1QT30_PARPR|nr:unnamed protein product [Paramecium primaurelia]
MVLSKEMNLGTAINMQLNENQIRQSQNLAMSSEIPQIKFFCGKNLVDILKVKSNVPSKEKIQQLKTSQQKINAKENQERLNHHKNILDQTMDLKRSIDFQQNSNKSFIYKLQLKQIANDINLQQSNIFLKSMPTH